MFAGQSNGAVVDPAFREAIAMAQQYMAGSGRGLAGDRWIMPGGKAPSSLPSSISAPALESTAEYRVSSGMTQEESAFLAELGNRGDILRNVLVVLIMSMGKRGESNPAALAEALAAVNNTMRYAAGELSNPMDIADALSLSGSRAYRGFGDTREPNNRVPELASSQLPYPLGVPARGMAIPASDTGGSGFDPVTMARAAASRPTPTPVATRASAAASAGKLPTATPSTNGSTRKSDPTPASSSPTMIMSVQDAERALASARSSGASSATISKAQQDVVKARKAESAGASGASGASSASGATGARTGSSAPAAPSGVSVRATAASAAFTASSARNGRPMFEGADSAAIDAMSSAGSSLHGADAEAMRATTTASGDPGIWSEVSNGVRRAQQPVQPAHPFFRTVGSQNQEEEPFATTGVLIQLKGSSLNRMDVLSMLVTFVQGLRAISVSDINAPISSGQADQILRNIDLTSQIQFIKIIKNELDMTSATVTELMRQNPPTMNELLTLANSLERELRPQMLLERVARASGAGTDGIVGQRLGAGSQVRSRAPAPAATGQNASVQLLTEAGVL